jgi:hypothetical protein
VLNSLVTGNSASLFGGGIDVDEGTLDVVNSTVSANTADQGSGGIDTDFGTVTLTGSTVSGNTVANGSAGGIWNFGGTLTLNNSTISGNSADNPTTTLARGGGIRNQSALDTNRHRCGVSSHAHAQWNNDDHGEPCRAGRRYQQPPIVHGSRVELDRRHLGEHAGSVQSDTDHRKHLPAARSQG